MTCKDFVESKERELAAPMIDHEEEGLGVLEALRLKAARRRRDGGSDALHDLCLTS